MHIAKLGSLRVRLPPLPPSVLARLLARPLPPLPLPPPPEASVAAARYVSGQACAALERAQSAQTCPLALADRFADPAQRLSPTLTALRISGANASAHAGRSVVTFVRANGRWLVAGIASPAPRTPAAAP